MGTHDDDLQVLSPRVGEDELSRILNLREIQERRGQIAAFARRYLELGWNLVVLDTERGKELPVDFRQPPEQWSRQLSDLEARDLPLGLGVRTGSQSQLLVVEITAGQGDLFLDRLGDWRSDWVAQGGDNLERHFYVLPAGARLPGTSLFQDALITVHGEGGWVILPPFSEFSGKTPWRWLTPPWSSPPIYPPPELWQFLRKHAFGSVDGSVTSLPEIPSWAEIHGLISPHAAVMQALLAPVDSPEKYYEDLLEVALEAGLQDPPLLLGLLWHAPYGDARHNPERWEDLVDLVSSRYYRASVSGVPLGSLDAPPTFSAEPLVVERHRYEAVLAELRRLSARVAELEQQVLQWSQSPAPEPTALAEPPPPSEAGQFHADSLDFLAGWSDLERQVAELVDNFLPDAELPEDRQHAFLESLVTDQEGGLGDFSEVLKRKVQKSQQEEEIEEAIQECLAENPDLADDQRKIDMIYYCLKNYVNFHPDLMGLSLRERVAEACRMAREFLGESYRAQPGRATS